ncbi:MAG: (Fe-S)-binding protein, partial [Candidatus Ratteibacteria bacterium]
FYARKIAGGKIVDEFDAKEQLKWIIEKINYCKNNLSKIIPNFERRMALQPVHIYKLLLQTNCKKCGENSCLAFAVKLVDEQINIALCKDLFFPAFDEKRKMIFDLLKSSGYAVPDI